MREFLFIRDSLPSRPARARRRHGVVDAVEGSDRPRERERSRVTGGPAARAPRNERATTDDARATNERQIQPGPSPLARV